MESYDQHPEETWEKEREIFIYKFKPTDGDTSTTKVKMCFKEASIAESNK